VAELAGLVVDHDLAVALAFVERLRARGVPVESVYLDLLAPVAHELGRQWEDDRRTFSEVTVGLWRLHQLLYELSPAFQRDAVAPSSGLRALLVTAPGEQHSFGLAMTAEFFRRAGWLVSGGPLLSGEDLPALVHREWFAIVGISAGSETRLDSVASAIHGIRRASRNRALGVLVGGVVFGGHPERVALVGADGCADDARRAPLQARALLDLLVHRD
jgi:methanogenic corrinoid protein MtbC1